MPLVSYSSSDTESESKKSDTEPQRKRQKQSNDGLVKSAATTRDMPPLPSAFHDLYASTVRQSVVDDPKLHHGRKRQTPHIVGQWPSHIYVEWHPNANQVESLSKLLDAIETELGRETELHRLLTSDLGSPLPLHISLSRPLSLSTAEKDDFLEQVTKTIESGDIKSFLVNPKGLAWFKSPDSDRAFLIIRVESASTRSSTKHQKSNPELMALLNSCNGVAGRFKQPLLYQNQANQEVGSAFHLSIAWTFGLPDEERPITALEVFNRKDIREAKEWDIDVTGIKVKIGNIVSHVPLPQAGSVRRSKSDFMAGG